MMEFWRVFLFLTAGGVIGGLLYWTSTYLSSFNKPLGGPSNLWSPSAWFCCANAFMGVGGAWAALLAMFWARRVPLGHTPTDFLELLAASIVAGFAGNRILPAVAAGMTQQLLESATETAVAAARSANHSRVVAEALAYLAPGAPQTEQQTTHVVTALQTELRTAPASGETAILLARALAERKNDNTGAVQSLRSFADENPKAVQADEGAVAAAFWNLAMYFEGEFQKNGRVESRQDAIAALTEAVRLLPTYRTTLALEPVFERLRNDPAAKPLL